MTAMVSMTANRVSCCSCAAASTSAPMFSLLDTAIYLAVSICVLALPLLRIIAP